MARFKSHLLVVIGFAVAGMIGAAFGTGTAQAVVATLVEVVNPSTSPVPTSTVNVTDPGRIAYQATVSNVGTCSGSSCSFVFGTVPSGHRIVIQHIGGTVTFTPSPGIMSVTIFSTTSPFITAFLAPIVSPFAFTVFDQPVLFYVDSGQQPTVSMTVVGNGAAFGPSQFVTLTGYELDCTVAACASIATQ